MSVFFISGIDTDIGKTYATGALAQALLQQMTSNHRLKSVITQKLVQTGCLGISEDIISHRKMMDIPLQPADHDGLTCPYVFTKPASPHLAAYLEDTFIDPAVITKATQALATSYDIVLLEGAGGLMVPLSQSLLTLDYVAAMGYPVILVTSGRLGSISHTLLSIEALSQRQIPLHAVIYNQWQPNTYLASAYTPDNAIKQNTQTYLQRYLERHHPQTYWVNLPHITDTDSVDTSQNTSQSMAKYASELLDTLPTV
ncbi:dethiobiotin synthase [Psychrobacter sanguinis]|uniref:ATP-dependent dethiobiotin synthetase BioD n=1 Tax=Psychrobacter sanguinis TaxID=861445 RepID=A0A844M1D8_9GAMM|nr:dethiobiotin synthase [Psychrobacter sanguinis]MUG32428.1 ATP-dependent dethiobiotin synthetase BioD [Psychrobacter sanguinis]